MNIALSLVAGISLSPLISLIAGILILIKLAKSGQDEFSVLFDRFVGEVAECVEEYSSGSFIGFGVG